MKDYNFAKNYENIKLWEYKEQTINYSAENNIFFDLSIKKVSG